MSEAREELSAFKLWFVASRPKTLPAAVAPVLAGSATAYREGVFDAAPAFVALIVALFIQVGTNFVNDYGDYKKGTDKKDRVGPQRFLASGIITPGQVKKAIFISFGIAFLFGLYLVRIGGLPALAVGIFSILAGIAYTAGPFPLAYNGLGDVFVMIFFGFVATAGTYYVQALSVSPLVLWVAVPVGLLITNILVVNNYRDADEDKRSNKKTLAVIFGKAFARFQYVASIVLSYLVLIYLFLKYDFSYAVFLPFLLLPFAVKLMREIFNKKGAALNETLGKTALFSAAFSLLLSIGIAL